MVNAPTANTVAAAEHGIALIAALSRNVAQADASVKAGRWERSRYTGVSIVGKTLAIMGFGKARPAWPGDERVRVRIRVRPCRKTAGAARARQRAARRVPRPRAAWSAALGSPRTRGVRAAGLPSA